MAKKKAEAVTESKWDEGALIEALAGLKGMSRDLAERIAKDSPWSTKVTEFAQKYGLTALDASAALAVIYD